MYIEKHSSRIFLLLHGRDNNEHLLPAFAEAVDPSRTILSLRGNLPVESGWQFFERYPANRESIAAEAEKLWTFLSEWAKLHTITLSDITPIGYSNGAMFMLYYLIHYGPLGPKMILLHPMFPFSVTENLDLHSVQLLITSGTYDQYTSEIELEKLRQGLGRTSAKLQFFQHRGGHEITNKEIEVARNFLAI